jgi:hypothetical protein
LAYKPCRRQVQRLARPYDTNPDLEVTARGIENGVAELMGAAGR